MRRALLLGTVVVLLTAGALPAMAHQDPEASSVACVVQRGPVFVTSSPIGVGSRCWLRVDRPSGYAAGGPSWSVNVRRGDHVLHWHADNSPNCHTSRLRAGDEVVVQAGTFVLLPARGPATPCPG